MAEDTLVIVTSDNGARPADVDGNTRGHKSCGELRGYKADIWDGGHREPFVARWPKAIKPGIVSTQTVCLADLTATCAAIVGAELPEHAAEDSFNFLPVLFGQSSQKPVREAIIHHSVDGMFSVRQNKWKLILGQGSGGFSEPSRILPSPGEPLGQLYDMENDISETTNLWNKYPEIVKRLTAILKLYKEQGHSRPL